MNKPFFSIVTASYNSEKTIFDTITSVLNQGFSDFEYLIIDGNSSDTTLQIIRSFENQNLQERTLNTLYFRKR